MKLTDVLPIEEWLALEKDIHERSGLNASVFDIDGIRITGYKQWANQLCPKIKAVDRGQSFICAVAQMNIAEVARQAKKAIVEECDAGLLKLVVPIFVNDEFIGSAGACGLILDDGEVDSFMVNKTVGLEVEEIERLAKNIGSISSEQAEALGAYIQHRIDDIVTDYHRRQTASKK